MYSLKQQTKEGEKMTTFNEDIRAKREAKLQAEFDQLMNQACGLVFLGVCFYAMHLILSA